MKYAEYCNYWKTSQKSADSWFEKTKDLIVDFGGRVEAAGYGETDGRAAFMLRWSIGGDAFNMVWPVLSSETGDDASAKRQAATMLYRDTKAKLISAEVLGLRVAFFHWLALPDGRTVHQLTSNELIEQSPQFLIGVSDQ